MAREHAAGQPPSSIDFRYAPALEHPTGGRTEPDERLIGGRGFPDGPLGTIVVHSEFRRPRSRTSAAETLRAVSIVRVGVNGPGSLTPLKRVRFAHQFFFISL